MGLGERRVDTDGYGQGNVAGHFGALYPVERQATLCRHSLQGLDAAR